MNHAQYLTAGLLGSLLALGSAAAHAAGPSPAPAATNQDAEYTKVLEKRTAPMLAALDLGDSTKAARVQARVIERYKSLNAWQEKYAPRIKELRDSQEESARAEIAAAYAARKSARDAFLADLAKDLTPAQVDIIKDKLTYNKLQVTYDGYIQMIPSLTGEQKKKIYEWLLQAREEGIDGVSSHEKDEIFGRYKGRINNYLSKEGYDLNKEGKDWKARRDAAGKK